MSKRVKVKGVDAMAIKDGYIATGISPQELYACNDKGQTLKGDYEMEGYGAMEEEDDEEEMD